MPVTTAVASGSRIWTSRPIVEGWDSFTNLNLIVATETRFGIKMRTDEIEGLTKVGDLVAIIVARASLMWSAVVPGGLLAWKQRRRALRDLDKIQRLEQSILGLDEANPVNRAKVALESGDTGAALQFWPKLSRAIRTSQKGLVMR